MNKKKMLIGISAVALLALMISNVYAGASCPPGLSPGYWKHNVKVYNGGPGHYSAQEEGMDHETDASMLAYAKAILGYSNPYGITIPAGLTPAQFLAWANGIFQSKQTYPGQWLNLANAFNSAAGRNPYMG